MASIGEVGSITPETSTAEPIVMPDIVTPEAPEETPVEAPAVVAKSAKPRNRVVAWFGSASRRLWKSRGLFGGLIALYLAFTAQTMLIERNAWETAQRLYVAAFVILILSLIHPTFAFFRRKPKAKVEAAITPVTVASTETALPDVDTIESTVVLEPHLNGSTAIGDQTLVTNGNLAEGNGSGNGNGHVEAETIGALEVIAPLPTRRAGRRMALDSSDSSVSTPVIAGAVTAAVIAEPELIAAPIAPKAARRAKVQPHTRPLDGSEVPAGVVAPSRKRRLKEAYFDLRARLGWKATLPLFLITVGLAVWLYFLFERDIASSVFGWIWFGTMLLMVAAFYGAPRWPKGLQGLLDGPDEGFFARGVPQPSAKLETVMVVLMMAGALAIRMWNLENLPGIFGDEGERGLDARGILHGNTDPIFGAGWWVVPNVYFYMLSWSLRIFGDNLFGDRMLSVVLGMLVIFLIYKIGRLLWGARAGLIAGALLAISPIWIMFSRHASESTPTAACWVIGFFFLFRALRFRQWVDWVLAGMGFGFSLYFYASGKLVVPLLAAVAGYMLVRWRWEFIKRYSVGYGLMLLAFMLSFLPHFVWLKIGNFDGFFLRARETSIFAPGHAAQVFGSHGVAYDPSLVNLSVVDNLLTAPWPWAQVIWNQFRISFDVLYRVSGGTTFFYQLRDHGGTLMTPLIAALTLLGVAYAVWKFWDARYGISLVWFVVGLAGVAFTMDTPHVQRIVGAWPVLLLFPAVMIDRVLASAWPLNIKFARRWLTVPVVGLLIFASYEAIREFFVVYEAGCSICASTVQARYVATFGNDYKGYLFGVGGYPVYFDYGSTRFTVPDAKGEDLNIPMDFFPVTSNNGKGLAFMFYPANLQYKSVVSMFYPDGIAQDMKGNDGSFIFSSYKVPPAQVAAMQSTFAEYTDAHGETVRKSEPNLGTARPTGVNPWSPPAQLIFPATASWQGGLVAPDFGQYTFMLSGGSDAVFEIDGKVLLDGKDPAKQQATVVLARGPHDVRLSGTLPNASSRMELGWAGGSGAPLPVSSNFLYNGVLGGLTATIGSDSSAPINAPDPFANQAPAKYQIHPFLSVRDAGGTTASFGGRPVFIRWQGTILAPVSGSYAFNIQSNGPNVMMIDGQTIINSQGGTNAPNPIMLSAGEHSVDIRYSSQGQPGGTFEWYWTPPGGESTIVPPSVLTPVKRMWEPGEVSAPLTTPNVAPPPPPSQAVKADAILGTSAGLKEAVGLGADAQGRVYIGDNGNSRVVVLDSSGNTVATWGSATEQSAQGKFGTLSDIWASPDGHLYTLDTKTGDIHVFNGDGTIDRYFPGLTRSSLGITADNLGDIFVGNTIGSAVLEFSPDGNLLHKFEGGPGGTLQHFEQPMDVAVGPDGTVYEIDMRGRVAQLDANGNIVREWPMQWGIARGGSHLVYWKGKLVMTDPDRHRLLVIDLATNTMSFVGQVGNSDSQMNTPVGIAVGANDKLYVMDSGNNRVLVFNDLDP